MGDRGSGHIFLLLSYLKVTPAGWKGGGVGNILDSLTDILDISQNFLVLILTSVFATFEEVGGRARRMNN